MWSGAATRYLTIPIRLRALSRGIRHAIVVSPCSGSFRQNEVRENSGSFRQNETLGFVPPKHNVRHGRVSPKDGVASHAYDPAIHEAVPPISLT